eukprot:366117-Chlamydomonas_euryale.AAC.12
MQQIGMTHTEGHRHQGSMQHSQSARIFALAPRCQVANCALASAHACNLSLKPVLGAWLSPGARHLLYLSQSESELQGADLRRVCLCEACANGRIQRQQEAQQWSTQNSYTCGWPIKCQPAITTQQVS